MNTRNNAIEFYRFLFSAIICLFHFKTYAQTDPLPFVSGYLVVEFFLMLSGFFLAQSAYRGRESNGTKLRRLGADCVRYAAGRYKRLFPHYLFAVLCLAAVRILILENMTVERWLSEGLTEIFMLQSVGDTYTLSVVLWFSSALFLASVFVYTLARLLGPSCVRMVFPFLTIVIWWWLISNNDSLDVTFSRHLLVSDGFWRAAAGLMAGCICFEVVQWTGASLKGLEAKWWKVLFSAIEFGTVILLAMILYTPGDTVRECAAIAGFMLLVVLVMSKEGSSFGLLNNRGSGYLGKISYAMYFNHISCYMLIFKFFPATQSRPFVAVAFVYLVAVIALSMVTTWLINVITSAFGARKIRLKAKRSDRDTGAAGHNKTY